MRFVGSGAISRVENDYSPAHVGRESHSREVNIGLGRAGVGDQLLFLSLLPFVMDKSPANLTVEVSYKLIKLVKAWYPGTVRGDDVVDTVGQSAYDQLDYQIPSGSLMRLVVNSTGKIDVNKRLSVCAGGQGSFSS